MNHATHLAQGVILKVCVILDVITIITTYRRCMQVVVEDTQRIFCCTTLYHDIGPHKLLQGVNSSGSDNRIAAIDGRAQIHARKRSRHRSQRLKQGVCNVAETHLLKAHNIGIDSLDHRDDGVDATLAIIVDKAAHVVREHL